MDSKFENESYDFHQTKFSTRLNIEQFRHSISGDNSSGVEIYFSVFDTELDIT